MKTFDKLIDIIKTYIKGEDLRDFKLEASENNEMKNLLDEFTFLYSHSSDKSIYLAERLKTIFEDNLFFTNAYFEKTSQYNNLSSKVRECLEINGQCFEFYPANTKNITKFFKYYQKEDNIIEVYEGEQMNDEALFVYKRKENLGILVPYIIKKQNIDKLVSEGFAERIDDSKLKIYSKCELVKLYNFDKNRFEPLKYLKDFNLIYVEDGDFYVCELCYSEKCLKNRIDLGKNLFGPSFKIVDKNGDFLKTDEIIYSQIIKKMRDAISHGNIFEYRIPIANEYNLSAFALVLKSKTDADTKFKCVVLCLSDLIRFLGYNCCISLGCEDGKHRFAMIPNLKSRILDKEFITNFMDTCCVVSIKNEQEFNELAFVNYVKDVVENYSKTGESAKNDNVKDRIEKKIKERFPNVVIDVEQICNIDLFNAKTINNPRFFKQQTKINHEQEIYLTDVFNNYYSAESLIVKSNGFPQKVQLKNIGIQDMTFKIKNILNQIEKGKIEKVKSGFYAFEYEMLLALLVVYVCLVKNDITDEMNRNNKNPYLNEMVKNTQTKSLEVKIADTNMSCFTFYDANGDQTRRKPNISKEKLNVVKWIKNAICHNGVFLQQPLAKNAEEQVLIFESVGEEGFNKNKTEKIHIVEVKCKDLMNYFLIPTFLEYKNDLSKIIKVATFDELMLKIKENIND